MSAPDIDAPTATERLTSKVGYIQYNYGPEHVLTKAAEAGDIAAFRAAGANITEMMDAVVVSIIDASDTKGVCECTR